MAAVRLATKVSAELERASNRVPCAESLTEARDAWLAYAGANNLASANTPLAIWGDIDDFGVSAIAVRDAFQHFHFELAADFPEPLGRGLILKPASSTTQLDRSGEPVGHPAFDKIFSIRATDPNDGPRLLGPETRDAILALRDMGLQMRIREPRPMGVARIQPQRRRHVRAALAKMLLIAKRIAANCRAISAQRLTRVVGHGPSNDMLPKSGNDQGDGRQSPKPCRSWQASRG